MARKTKIIQGVEHGCCGNYCTDPRYRVTRPHETPEQAAKHEAVWLANAVLLAPEATEHYTAEKLAKMDMRSVWKPMTKAMEEVDEATE